jgi:transcriptional regulator with XRE-family HTH domain
MATIGENLKRIRATRGITQHQLAKRSGLTYSTLAKIEGGFVKKPGVQMIAKIAKALNIYMEDLLK